MQGGQWNREQLGIANVVWQLPLGLREAHAANAATLFIAYVCAIVLASIDGTVRTAVAVAPGRMPASAAQPAQPQPQQAQAQ